MILDGHVARQRRDVGHDDVVAQRAIVRDVAIGEDGVVRTDARDFAVAGRAVDRDVFAKRVAIADFRARDATLPLQVLRFQPDAREREYFVFPAQFRVAVNDDVRMQFAAVAERHVFADDAVRANFTLRANLRLRMNNCCVMNHAILFFCDLYHFPVITGTYSKRWGRAACSRSIGAARPSYPAAQQRRPTHCTDCFRELVLQNCFTFTA